MNLQLYMLVLSILTSISVTSGNSNLSHAIDTPECTAWVDSVYQTLTPTDRIAQLMVVNVSPMQGSKSKANIKAFCDLHVGGFLFSKGSVNDFAEMTNYAQAHSKVPLLMTLDGEWGAAMRVQGAPTFPYNMALGAIRDPQLLYRYGEEMARECHALGIQVNFAPVLDVNSNPDNPVIGRRSFGEDPHKVAELGLAYSLGLEDGGVMAVGKHFPGHGDTNTDSHKALPNIDHDLTTLTNIDLYPFKRFIDAGCSGVMVGHLSVPALEKAGWPSSMSKKITTDLLKDQMGFKGMVFTDGLGMEGATISSNTCVAALKAGADVLLNPRNASADIAAIRKAIADGEISQSTIDERCRKMLAYKYALGLNHLKPIDLATIDKTLNTPQAHALIQELADASITALTNKDNTLPLTGLGTRSIAVVNIGASADNEFSLYCRKYAGVDVYGSKESAFTQKQVSDILSHDVVIAAVYSDGHAAVNALASMKSAKTIVPVFFVNPYKLTKFKTSIDAASAVLLAYDDSPQLRIAAAKGVFGGIEVDGRLPVDIKGVASTGQGAEIPKTRLGYASPEAKGLDARLTAKIDSVVNLALSSGAFPGAQVLVAKGGDIVVDRNYGLTTKGGEKVTSSTIYDLASVSKTVGTLPGVMKAYDSGLFDLDTPAYKYVSEMNVDGKREITPRMLLYHETGIPAALNMFNVMMDSATYTGKLITNKRDTKHTIAINGGGYGNPAARLRRDITSPTRTEKFDTEAAKGIFVGDCTYDTIMANIYRSKIKPDRGYVYSCLNFCILMDMEQRLTGQAHDKYVTDSIWGPIGAYTLCYRPADKYPMSQIAATEQDTYLRRQHVRGYVHDETAAFSGGVQGNAGVFGNATDVAKLCQMWLNGGEYGGERVLSEETTRLFTTSKSAKSRRGLGFDKPDMTNSKNSPTCDEAGAGTYGHTGFTGTCFWVDPDEDLIFVFLSNRVDPSRSNSAFSKSSIRPTLMSLVYDSIKK